MSDDQAVSGAGGHSRRALLAGVGALGASVVLTGCGAEEGADKADTATGSPSTPASGGDTAGGVAVLAQTSEIPVGGGKVYASQGVVVTQPTAGEFKAFAAICTHQGCPVASVDGGTINCTCHGSRFSIQDGSARSGPATKPLPAREVKVDGGNIVLG